MAAQLWLHCWLYKRLQSKQRTMWRTLDEVRDLCQKNCSQLCSKLCGQPGSGIQSRNDNALLHSSIRDIHRHLIDLGRVVPVARLPARSQVAELTQDSQPCISCSNWSSAVSYFLAPTNTDKECSLDRKRHKKKACRSTTSAWIQL